MKKIICLLLTVCLIFTFAACGTDDQPQNPDTDTPAAGDNSAGTETPDDAESTDQDKEQDSEDETKPDDEIKPDEEEQKPEEDSKKDDKDAGKDEVKPADKPSATKPSKPSTETKPSKPSTATKPSKPSSDKTESSKNNKPSSALNLLETVWKGYSENDKFPAAGGDFSEENMKDGAPGNFTDREAFESTLAVPEDSKDMVQKAASLTHMMNLNTFTAGAFQLKDSKNADKFAKAMKESIENRRWVCSFPDKFVIIKVDGYVVSAFGAADLIDTFKSKTLKAYKNASVYCEQNVE